MTEIFPSKPAQKDGELEIIKALDNNRCMYIYTEFCVLDKQTVLTQIVNV